VPHVAVIVVVLSARSVAFAVTV